MEKMYSNFVTPPDFVTDSFHTITVIEATTQEVELLGKMCQSYPESLNIYLYKKEMNNVLWLEQAVKSSNIVIANIDGGDYVENYCVQDNVYYYGSKILACPANKIDSLLRYFALRATEINNS